MAKRQREDDIIEREWKKPKTSIFSTVFSKIVNIFSPRKDESDIERRNEEKAVQSISEKSVFPNGSTSSMERSADGFSDGNIRSFVALDSDQNTTPNRFTRLESVQGAPVPLDLGTSQKTLFPSYPKYIFPNTPFSFKGSYSTSDVIKTIVPSITRSSSSSNHPKLFDVSDRDFGSAFSHVVKKASSNYLTRPKHLFNNLPKATPTKRSTFGFPDIFPAIERVVPSNIEEFKSDDTYNNTAKRIIETLEQISTPLMDLKRMKPKTHSAKINVAKKRLAEERLNEDLELDKDTKEPKYFKFRNKKARVESPVPSESVDVSIFSVGESHEKREASQDYKYRSSTPDHVDKVRPSSESPSLQTTTSPFKFKESTSITKANDYHLASRKKATPASSKRKMRENDKIAKQFKTRRTPFGTVERESDEEEEDEETLETFVKEKEDDFSKFKPLQLEKPIELGPVKSSSDIATKPKSGFFYQAQSSPLASSIIKDQTAVSDFEFTFDNEPSRIVAKESTKIDAFLSSHEVPDSKIHEGEKVDSTVPISETKHAETGFTLTSVDAQQKVEKKPKASAQIEVPSFEAKNSDTGFTFTSPAEKINVDDKKTDTPLLQSKTSEKDEKEIKVASNISTGGFTFGPTSGNGFKFDSKENGKDTEFTFGFDSSEKKKEEAKTSDFSFGFDSKENDKDPGFTFGFDSSEKKKEEPKTSGFSFEFEPTENKEKSKTQGFTFSLASNNKKEETQVGTRSGDTGKAIEAEKATTNSQFVSIMPSVFPTFEAGLKEGDLIPQKSSGFSFDPVSSDKNKVESKTDGFSFLNAARPLIDSDTASTELDSKDKALLVDKNAPLEIPTKEGVQSITEKKTYFSFNDKSDKESSVSSFFSEPTPKVKEDSKTKEETKPTFSFADSTQQLNLPESNFSDPWSPPKIEFPSTKDGGTSFTFGSGEATKEEKKVEPAASNNFGSFSEKSSESQTLSNDKPNTLPTKEIFPTFKPDNNLFPSQDFNLSQKETPKQDSLFPFSMAFTPAAPKQETSSISSGFTFGENVSKIETTTPTFGQESASGFGGTPFSQRSSSSNLFGQTESQKNPFGSVDTINPFASSGGGFQFSANKTTPSFGANSAPTFGTNSAPSFGANTTTPTFGANSGPSLNTNATPFVPNASLGSSAGIAPFGANNSQFGANNLQFGANNPQFGANNPQFGANGAIGPSKKFKIRRKKTNKFI